MKGRPRKLVRLVVPKEIREQVRAQPARKRFRRKTRIMGILELSLVLFWLALNPAPVGIFVFLGVSLFLGIFTVIWTWKDLKEMREFEKALWAKNESEHQLVNTEKASPS